MKVRVERTSMWSGSECPYPGAINEGGDGLLEGKWYVDVESLWALHESVGCEIILKTKDGERVVEIYDDYRE
jgi:hypothetical protein